MKKTYLFILIVVVCINFISCREVKIKEKYILTTTQMLYDIVINLVDSSFEVEYLMGEGVDPHLYKFSQKDLQKLNKSTLIICNGLHLEGKMNYVLKKLAFKKTVISAGDSLSKNKLIQVQGEVYDPHIWFSVDLWKKVVKVVSYNLQKKFPNDAQKIISKEKSYIYQLSLLQKDIEKQISQIPEEQRVLITSHDAFRYFEKSFNFPVKALQGISTTAEYGLKEIQELVDFIYERKIKAVFVETSLPPKGLEAVVQGLRAKNYSVKLVEGLYSDAMGTLDTPEGTYIGMFKSNVSKIVEALK